MKTSSKIIHAATNLTVDQGRNDLPKKLSVSSAQKNSSHASLSIQKNQFPNERSRTRSESEIANNKFDKLKQVLNKKIDVQKVGSILYELEKNLQDSNKTVQENPSLHSKIKDQEILNFEANASIEKAFDEEKSLLLRTLNVLDQKEVNFRSIRFGHAGKTPTRRELDTLNNAVSSRNTVIVPATLINKNVRSRTISQREFNHEAQHSLMLRKTLDGVF